MSEQPYDQDGLYDQSLGAWPALDRECLCGTLPESKRIGSGHIKACPLSEGEPYTVKCQPNRGHPGVIEFSPRDARHPICPVCSQEVVR